MEETQLKKTMNIEIDRNTKGLFKAGLEKEKFFLFALSDPQEHEDETDTISKEEALHRLFLDFCRIEDKIYFNHKVELDDARRSQEIIDYCSETQTITVNVKTEEDEAGDEEF